MTTNPTSSTDPTATTAKATGLTGGEVTNTYGRRAQAHMRRYLPGRFATIPNPDSYFQMLGEQVSAQVAALENSLSPPAVAGEAWIDTVGKARMTRMMAEGQVMAEMVWLSAEPDPTEPTIGPNGGWIGSDPGLADLVTPGLTQADLDEIDALT